MIFVNIESIKAIKIGKYISSFYRLLLPAFIVDLGRVWEGALYDQNPRTNCRRSPAFQGISFHSLDIQFEPVNVAPLSVLENRSQCPGRHGYLVGLPACLSVDFSVARHPCAHSRVFYFEEIDLVRYATYGSFDNQFIWPCLAQPLNEAVNRLHMNSPPATFIERETHRIFDRVVRSHVHIVSVSDMLQRAPKDNIFEVLSV